MLLTELLLIEETDLKVEMKRHFDEVSRKYFSEFAGKFPQPSLIARLNLMSTGRAGLFKGKANEIIVDKDYANEPDSLKSILWHEAIHYYEWWGLYNGCKERNDINRWNMSVRFDSNGHGKFFVDSMKRINSGEGKTVVLPTDKSVILSSIKPFYVYVFQSRSQSDKYNFCWSVKKEQAILDKIIKWAKGLGQEKIWHGESNAAFIKLSPRITAGISRLSASVTSPSDPSTGWVYIAPLVDSSHEMKIAA